MPTIPHQAYRLAHRLLRLRNRVRKPRTLGVRVVVLHDNRVVLVRHCYGDSRWMLPGGGLKRTETIHECLRRELREETGLDVGSRAVTAEIGGVFESTIDNKHDLVIAPVLHLEAEPQLVACNEIMEVTLAPLDALPTDVSSSTRAVLDRLGGPTVALGRWGV